MNRNAIFVAAFSWAVSVVPLAAWGSAEPDRAGIPSRDSLPAVSAGTDGRELFDGSEARVPTALTDPAPALAAPFGPGAGVDQGVAGLAWPGHRAVPPAGGTAVPAPVAGAASRQAGSEKGFCNGSFREFDQRVGKVPVLRELLSVILLPVVVYCTLAN